MLYTYNPQREVTCILKTEAPGSSAELITTYKTKGVITQKNKPETTSITTDFKWQILNKESKIKLNATQFYTEEHYSRLRLLE
jgi:hypothetical protein